jgi:hypothetical protein
MSRRLRFSLANVLLAVTCFALAIGWWWTVPLPPAGEFLNRPPTDAGIQMLPLTISMSQDYGLSPGWYFSVNSTRDGEMSIIEEPTNIVQPVKVTATQLKELRDLLVREQFFTLNEDYGELVPDGGSQTLNICAGEWNKTVRIHFLGNWVSDHDTARLREPARAVRVWMLIRGWFSHPKAPNSRGYDQAVLDAIKVQSENGN